jgi:glycosyltransferase involved in cell wall biosynthesis
MTLRHYDQVICVSEDLQEECLRHGVRPDRTCVIHNAIDTEQFRRTLSRTDAKLALQAPSSGLLLGAMGRLSDEKGFDLLIQAVVQLARQGHDFHLWIAGEGPCRSALESEIHRNMLGGRVKLLGLVPDPRLFLQATDVFVLSSLREGLPNVVLEAMAMETPVVATRVAGVPNLLMNGELGVLVEPRSVAGLVAGIAQLATDEQQRHRLAELARRKIEQDYSFEKRMRRVAALYDRLLGLYAESVNNPQFVTA